MLETHLEVVSQVLLKSPGVVALSPDRSFGQTLMPRPTTDPWGPSAGWQPRHGRVLKHPS